MPSMFADPYLIDKPLGATPLEALNLLRTYRPEIGDAKLAYAGRLDPMATGLLLALHGEALHHQEDFWRLPKVYEAQIILGWSTDSGDLLGLPSISLVPSYSTDVLLRGVASLVGKQNLSVPIFSSPVVQGKPLFQWAHEGRIPDVEIPIRRMAVSEIHVSDISAINVDTLRDAIDARIPRVRGMFRQQEIMTAWKNIIPASGEWPLLSLRISCSSGTYIRSLAEELGRRLDMQGMLFSLRRTMIGEWSVTAESVLRPVWPQSVLVG
jgi:tRNA pseudouridine55 synthase